MRWFLVLLLLGVIPGVVGCSSGKASAPGGTVESTRLFWIEDAAITHEMHHGR